MRTKMLDDLAVVHSIVKWPHYYFSTSFHNEKYAVSIDGFYGSQFYPSTQYTLEMIVRSMVRGEGLFFGHLAFFFLVSHKDWSCCTVLRELNTPPREGEKKENFANIGLDLKAKLQKGSSPPQRGRGPWHGRGKKCVIWFQEGSPDSELAIQQPTLKTENII